VHVQVPGRPNGAGKENGNLVTFTASTNGLTEYTASNFGGALKGDLLTASFDDKIWRIDLDAAGTGLANGLASKTELVTAATNGKFPLDVTALGDGGPFPGTVWFTNLLSGTIGVLEPADYGGGRVLVQRRAGDGDGDGFSNADETANGTNPCSAADMPPDLDGDKVSDRGDNDDDADGIVDVVDVFARDRFNGLTTKLPIDYNWENDNRDLGGILGLGFTGLMANGTTDYLDQYDVTKMTPGGAAGVVVLDQVDPGEAYQATNTQKYGFQFGVDASPANGPFTVTARAAGAVRGGRPEAQPVHGRLHRDGRPGQLRQGRHHGGSRRRRGRSARRGQPGGQVQPRAPRAARAEGRRPRAAGGSPRRAPCRPGTPRTAAPS
jgi:hypothetical protein